MHRRQLLALTGALGAGSAATVVLGGMNRPSSSEAAEADESDGLEEEIEDEEIENPRSGWSDIIYSVQTDQPVAAITFDDGPDPDFTPEILDILDRYDITATFMVMGHNAEQHPHLVAEVRDAGHEIGHHSWRHLNLANISVAETREEIMVGMAAVSDIAGTELRWFRPPRGRLSESAIKLLVKEGQDVVQWSVTRGALAERDPTVIADNIVDACGPGDIILLHDGIGRGTFKPSSPEAEELRGRRSSEVEALPSILQRIHDKGIRLGTVSDVVSVRSTALT